MILISYSGGQTRELADSKAIKQLMQPCPKRDMLRFQEFMRTASFNAYVKRYLYLRENNSPSRVPQIKLEILLYNKLPYRQELTTNIKDFRKRQK